MAAIEEPQDEILTMRGAAQMCGVSERTIGRKLSAGALPGAFKVEMANGRGHTAWRIPIGDLRAAGLLDAGPATVEAPEPETAHPETTARSETTLELVGSDRFARLRSELAEAVAAAELSLVRAEIAKWKAIADERGRSLERADFVLQTVAARARTELPVSELAPSALAASDATENAPRAALAIAEIPEHVREEARRYAQASPALRELHASRRWRRHERKRNRRS